MYRIVFLLFSSLLLCSCAKKASQLALPYYNEPGFTPVFIQSKADVDKLVPHKIASFSFLNQDSLPVTQQSIEGKIHVANFIFTSCGSICPVMTHNLKIVSDSLRDDSNLVLLSYSVTPWIDKPHVLKRYRERNGITNEHWQFLTGSKGEIYSLARQSYFAEEDLGYTKDSTEFLHTEHVVLVDKTKRIRGIYNGTLALEMQHLIEDIRTLENDQ